MKDITFSDLFAIAEKAGIESQKKQNKCRANGGHYRDKKTTMSNKSAFWCRCGFLGIVTYPHWRKGRI